MSRPAVRFVVMSLSERERLIGQAVPYAREFARHWSLTHGLFDQHLDGVVSDCLLCLVVIYEEWDPARFSWEGFYRQRLPYRLVDLSRERWGRGELTDAAAARKVAVRNTLTLDPAWDRPTIECGFGDVEIRDVLGRVRLDDRTRRMVEARARGVTYQRIAAEHGVSESRVQQVVEKVRALLMRRLAA